MANPVDTSSQNQALLPPPPPPVVMAVAGPQSHIPHGSVGPAIAVVAVIAVLGVVAGMIGRICAGRSFMGYGHFDVEGWMNRKFSSCIDGHVDALPPRRYRPPPPEVAPAPVAGDELPAEEGEEGGNENSHNDEHC